MVALKLKPKVSLRHKPGVESPGLNKFRNNHNWVSACIRGERSVVLDRPVCADSNGFVADLPLSACYGENQEIVDRLHLWTGLSIDEERDWDYWKPAQGPGQLSKGNPEMPTEIQSRSLENRFRGFRLHWKKVIGKGGFGLVTLWEVEFEDGHREDVVFKVPKEPSEKIYRELLWHDRYRMSSAIVQARDLVEEAEDHKLNGRFAHGEVFDPEKENILVLEYMNRGSLHSVLQKAAMRNRMFTSTALWQLWQFLLVAQDEESNIKFKLHDFGPSWSKQMREKWEKWPQEHYWAMRGPVKPRRHLPEQHAKEWDSIELPDPLGTERFTSEEFGTADKSKIAGRYGSWTNVFIIGRTVSQFYLVGLTLESAITLLRYVHPFRAERVEGEDPDVTYGYRTRPQDYPHVDPQLISVMHRCMREEPPRRDSIVRLLRDVVRARLDGKMDSDDETEEFWDTVFQPAPETDRGSSGEPDGRSGTAGDQTGEAEQEGNPMSRDISGPRNHAISRRSARSRVVDQPEFKIRGAARRAKSKELESRLKTYSEQLGDDVPMAVRNMLSKAEDLVFSGAMRSN
ncbi:hypothetical protein ACRE_027250 [Hapsidospora chrysogenum ATCC 11550]|uniref:Protein kinase domain-containing protein n=1 Tax=Hapsidospora chrysogenum (strain ATCC 11550 / CBS 779.69 / DSM 880 / IAM 14645 / JCM 23072 / IMI 49137) TaxID=857340 RepID=A0A086TAS7_HAPC1|nr:hypothetical protein ACRE_027250 [Hapsidospora chrysogenum ATCC 11550]